MMATRDESTPQLPFGDSSLASDSGISALEVEGSIMVEQKQPSHGESCRHAMRNNNKKQLPKWMLPFRYAGLAFLAVLLTVTCPGDTILWNRTNGASPSAWLIAFLVAYVSTVGGMLYVHRSDPGYITPEMLQSCDDGLSLLGHSEECGSCQEEEEEGDGLTMQAPSTQHRRRIPSPQPLESSSAPRQGEVTPLFQGTRRKFCDSCQFAPPLRSHHCKICHNCVATYDHHCPLVGNCIGERNRAAFWLFLLVQAMSFYLLCHIMGSSRLGMGTVLTANHHTSTEDVFDALRVLVSKAYLYTLTFMAYTMLGFHTLLAMGNVTTFEFRKGPRHLDYLRGTRDMDLPFSRGGCVGNVSRLCCSNSNSLCSPNAGAWKPTLWTAPGKIVRDSEDWWEHPWQNKYWSCC